MFSVEKEEIISKSSTLEYMDQNSLTTVILITAVQILLKGETTLNNDYEKFFAQIGKKTRKIRQD